MLFCSGGQVPANCATASFEYISQAKEATNRLNDILKDAIKSTPGAEKIIEEIIENMSSGLFNLECYKAVSDPGPTVRGGSICSDDRKSEISSGKRKAVPIPSSDGRGATRRRSQAAPGKTVTSSTLDDGHTWRKYGQKIIQGSLQNRSYFRCTHKHDQGCQATRQVQKSDDNPSEYIIKYMGFHTCRDPSTFHQIIDMPDQKETSNSILINFGSKSYSMPTKTISQAAQTQVHMPTPSLQSPNTQDCSEEVLSNLTPDSSPADCFMGDELAALVGSRNCALNLSSIHDQVEMISSLHSSPRSLEMGFMPNSFAQLDQDTLLFGFDHEDGDFTSNLR